MKNENEIKKLENEIRETILKYRTELLPSDFENCVLCRLPEETDGPYAHLPEMKVVLADSKDMTDGMKAKLNELIAYVKTSEYSSFMGVVFHKYSDVKDFVEEFMDIRTINFPDGAKFLHFLDINDISFKYHLMYAMEYISFDDYQTLFLQGLTILEKYLYDENYKNILNNKKEEL